MEDRSRLSFRVVWGDSAKRTNPTPSAPPSSRLVPMLDVAGNDKSKVGPLLSPGRDFAPPSPWRLLRSSPWRLLLSASRSIPRSIRSHILTRCIIASKLASLHACASSVVCAGLRSGCEMGRRLRPECESGGLLDAGLRRKEWVLSRGNESRVSSNLQQRGWQQLVSFPTQNRTEVVMPRLNGTS